MAGGLDIIKQYLISIGFNLDENSMRNAENQMNEADKTIRNSQKQNQQEFTNSSNVLRGLFDLVSSNPQMRSFIPSNLRGELNNILNQVIKIRSLDLNNILINLFPPGAEGQANESFERIKNSISKFTTQGSDNILRFSGTSVVAFGTIAIAIKSYISLIEGTISLLKDLSDKDIGYEKLARQLWTTKENAREVNKALETMGISMEDLWLSPTLLKQFNQLRKDSKDLKLPDDYNINLKTIQQISTEFARTKQMGGIAFEWVGNSIIKNLKTPLEGIMDTLDKGNNWLKSELPSISDNVGKFASNFIKPLANDIYIIIELVKKAKQEINNIETKIENNKTLSTYLSEAKKAIKSLNTFNINSAFPFISDFKIAKVLIQDLANYFKTGNSPMMDFFSSIGDKLSDCKENVSDIIDNISNWYDNAGFKKAIDDVEEWINTGIEKIDGFIDKINEKLLFKLPKIKDDQDNQENKQDDSESTENSNTKWYSKLGNIASEAKKTLIDSTIRIISQDGYIAKKGYETYQSYQGYTGYVGNTTNSTQQDNRQTNSNNNISNHNTFNVTGNDANSNATAVKNTLDSIITRNLG